MEWHQPNIKENGDASIPDMPIPITENGSTIILNTIPIFLRENPKRGIEILTTPGEENSLKIKLQPGTLLVMRFAMSD
jgi:hypothetical protein